MRIQWKFKRIENWLNQIQRINIYFLCKSQTLCQTPLLSFSSSRFRHYYRYILTLRFLDPNHPGGITRRRSASTGLILASAVTLQMTTQITCNEDNEAGGSSTKAMVARSSSSNSSNSQQQQNRKCRRCCYHYRSRHHRGAGAKDDSGGIERERNGEMYVDRGTSTRADKREIRRVQFD